VQLVNWSGAIFGPGSEWLWSFAQFVVVVVTLLGIYRQLRAQGATNALQRIDTLQGRWQSPTMTYAKLEFALAMRDRGSKPVPFRTYVPIIEFFAELAALEQEGYASIDEVSGNSGLPLQIWTALGEPALEALRAENMRPELYSDVETLVERVREQFRRQGARPVTTDADTIRRSLDFVIETSTDELRREYAIRAGTLPPIPTAEVVA